MTRIVAGAARGRRLAVPAHNTRPTSDRVREALFSSLDSGGLVRGANVLDLFAGTGALGLEALSRGARRAVLVDQSAAAVRVMEANIAAVGLPGATAHKRAAAAFLAGAHEQFDLVFLDPPYDLSSGAVSGLLAALADGWLGDRAVVVVERGRDVAGVTWPQGMEPDWQRRFGDTHLLRAVWYGREQAPPT